MFGWASNKSAGGRLAWLAVACGLLLWRGPAWRAALVPKTYYEAGFLADFFQEWASAGNYFQGLPIYTAQEETLQRYLGQRRAPDDAIFTEVNAHPPSSVLLALPFGKLGYGAAFRLWNAICLVLFCASVYLVLDGLGTTDWTKAVLAVVAVSLVCHPLWSHVHQGQLGMALVFLTSLCWRLDRGNRPWLAGLCLGAAAAIKLFPGFLFLPFVLRRRWRAVLSGVASAAVLSIATLAVLGFSTYRAYVYEVLPAVAKYRGACHNLSLCGMAHKLWAPVAHWMPVSFVGVSPRPVVATCVWLLFGALVVALVWWAVRRGPDDWDVGFSAAIVAMLLVGPITWDHYLLFLLLPVAVLWQRLPRTGLAWPAFLLASAILWIEPLAVMEHCLILMGAASEGGRWIATPVETLTALSVPSYALFTLFVLLVFAARRRREGIADCNRSEFGKQFGGS